MLPLAYALFIAIAAAGWLANPGHRGRYTALLIRALAGTVAAAAGGVALLLLAANDDEHTSVAVALLGLILAGSLVYLSGLVLWQGRVALLLRTGGWILLVLPVLFPSTLTLALPILALLTVTMSTAPIENSSHAKRARHAIG